MATSALLKSKKVQIAVLIALTAAVILFSLLTDFPEGDGQGSVRNKRFGPAVQSQTQTQSAPQNNLNNPAQSQSQGNYSQPANNINSPIENIVNPAANSYGTQDNGY